MLPIVPLRARRPFLHRGGRGTGPHAPAKPGRFSRIAGDRGPALKSQGSCRCFHRSNSHPGQPWGHNIGWGADLEAPVRIEQSSLPAEGRQARTEAPRMMDTRNTDHNIRRVRAWHRTATKTDWIYPRRPSRRRNYRPTRLSAPVPCNNTCRVRPCIRCVKIPHCAQPDPMSNGCLRRTLHSGRLRLLWPPPAWPPPAWPPPPCPPPPP